MFLIILSRLVAVVAFRAVLLPRIELRSRRAGESTPLPGMSMSQRVDAVQAVGP